jgi:NADH-quinone oxidoreductase subunit C
MERLDLILLKHELQKDERGIIILPESVNIKALLSDLKMVGFDMLTDLFCADFPSNPKRFEIVYNLLSLADNERLYIKIHVSDHQDLKQVKADTVSDIFKAADWYEREIFDMFGIDFVGHPNMKRILTDYGFEGHPLRKDFPLSGYVEVHYDKELEKVKYKPVELDQEYRTFDFESSWKGPEEYLPGDEKATKIK